MLLAPLLVACAAWPDPCPGAYHPSEAHYAIVYKQYNALVLNYSTSRQREYDLARTEYRTKWPAYERGVRAVDARFWQLLVLRGQIVPLPRDKFGREQQQPSWHIELLGKHDEKLYWEAIKAFGPKPVLPVFRPYHLIDVVGVKLLAILTTRVHSPQHATPSRSRALSFASAGQSHRARSSKNCTMKRASTRDNKLICVHCLLCHQELKAMHNARAM